MLPERRICGRYSTCADIKTEMEKLTVKFKISENEIVAQVYPTRMTIAEVLLDLSQKFEVDSRYLVICQTGKEVKPEVKIGELETNEFGIAETALKIDQDEPGASKFQLDPQVYYNKHKLPDFITVSIPSDRNPNCPCNSIIVEIQNLAIEKPYLGGHRDLRTGKEYYDAYTQTGPPLEKIKFEGIVSRDSQTAEIRSKGIDTVQDHSTQSFGDATNLIFVNPTSDHIIEPRPYETYEEKVKRVDKLGKIILIQRNLRRYILWKFITSAAAEYRRLKAEQERREKKIFENDADHLRRSCVIKSFPRTKEDFDLLFAQVQRWKDAEIKRINDMYSGGPRIAELNLLLDREVQLLNGIERQRTVVRKALQDFRDEKHLRQLGEPIQWVGYRNIVIEMDLIRTQRVRYLTELYKSMKASLKKGNRLELVNKTSQVLKKELKDKPGLTAVITELLDLLDREKCLLVQTKMGSCTLDTLRKRQAVLFKEVIEYEEEFKPKKPESKMCDKCKVVKPISNFALRTRQSSVDICKNCHYMRGTASDNSLYKAILRCIQRDERKHGALASYAFIMQEDDIRFIIEKIWHSHSILSKCNEVPQLRLPRWIRSDDWSPWNCICLTEAETRAHEHLNNLSEVYQETTLQDIQSKHLLAKSAFEKLKDIDYDYVEPGHWWDAGIEQKVV